MSERQYVEDVTRVGVCVHGKICPKCRTPGVDGGLHQVVLRSKAVEGLTIEVLGWRCWKCGYEWGFENE